MKNLYKNINRRIIASLLAFFCVTGVNGCKGSKEDTIKEHNETSEHQSAIESIIDKVEIDEPYFGYTDEDVHEFIETSEFEYCCPNEVFDIDALYERILSNSNVIDESNMFFYSETASDKEKEEVLLYRRALLQALRLCFDGASNDIYEDFCKMSDIKIIRTDYGNPASFHYNKNLITVNTDVIKLDCETSIKNKDYEEYVAMALAHELNHVRQFACRHSAQKAYSVKDYGFSTAIESSAESQKYHLSTVLPDNILLMYGSIRQGENMLFLIPSCIQGKSIDDYYNSMFDSNLKGLYDFFNLNTAEDYRAFYDILYGLETIDGRTEYLKNSLEEERVLCVGPSYRISAFKMALSNLSKTISEEKLSVDDAIMLYSIVKNEIIFYDPYRIYFSDEYIEQFNSGISACEEEFKSFIMNFYQITTTEFEEILNFISYRYQNINEDSLLENFPILKKIVSAYPISQETIITINDQLDRNKQLNRHN